MNTDYSILIVEDDLELAATISEYLSGEGFRVAMESNGAVAEKRLLVERPDLVILDMMLPGKDGISICRDIRPHFPGYIIMFTAREDEVDQIVGLELGADDYLIKPVKPRLLLAKIKSFLRRPLTGEASNHEPFCFGELCIDMAKQQVSLSQTPVSLTNAEFDLLILLAQHAGETLSRQLITQRLKGGEYDGIDRGIDNRISQLRKKLNDDGREPYRIKTVRNKGYVLIPGAW
jgi:DNA-binding response OmpR family regulator